MKVIFSVLILLFLLNAELYSQKSYPKQHIGLDYSTYSGSGISYLIELNPSFAFKFTGLFYYIGDDPPDVIDIYTIAGLEFQYNIFKTEKIRNYALAGISYWYIEERTKTEQFINDKLIINRVIEKHPIINFGLGTGIEYKLLKNLSISADIGLHYQLSDSTNYSPLFDRDPNAENFIGIGAGIGIRLGF